MNERAKELIDLLKDDVIKQINNLNYDNVSSIKKSIDKSFQYVLLSIDILNNTLSDDSDHNDEAFIETQPDTNLMDANEGVFYETVDGGYIERENEKRIIVSESVRRKTDLTHGDIVTLIPRDVSDNSFPYTIHNQHKKKNIPPSNLQKFDKAILEHVEDEIIIKRNTNRERLKDDLGNDWTFRVPFTRKFFQEDSLLAELVWVKGKARSTANIRWRYDMGNYKNKELYTEENIAYINSILNEDSQLEQEEQEMPKNLLNGTRSLLVGINPKKKGSIKKTLINQGSDVKVVLKGRRFFKDEFFAAVQDNDINFIVIGEDLSANGLFHARKLSKETGIPFIQFNGTDKKELLDKIIEYSKIN